MLFAQAYPRRPVFRPRSIAGLLCTNGEHPLPVRTVVIGTTRHHTGASLVIHGCPVCRRRHLVGRDFQTGQPRVIAVVPGR